MFLSISTSSGFASVSLFDDNEKLLKTITNDEKNAQSKNIAVFVKKILQNVDKNNIINIFVDIGPGSFTGIRTGVALAIGLGIFGTKISGISSLQAINYHTNQSDVFIKTIRDEYYYQNFKNNQPTSEARIVSNVCEYQEICVDSEMIGKCGIWFAKQGIFYDIMPIYVKEPNIG